MAQDASPPGGLLSKVVKFVRNPTVNWSELDQMDERESQYSKHVLKEMIERKRANDFVRRREFEQLRKLRQRTASGSAATMAAPDDSDFFDSSQPAGVGQREGTLKKIDEIEAQMAQQQPWPRQQEAAAAMQFAPTVDAEHAQADERVTDFAATDIQPRESIEFPAPQEDMLPGVDWSFGASRHDAAGFVSDPGLEEAAIRFANGDDAGCEAALLALIGSDAPAQVHQRAWAALFDLYRATAQHGRFETMSVDFSMRHHRPAPVWCVIADQDPGPADGASAGGQALAWTAPAVLDAGQVTALAVQLAAHPSETVQLDWTVLDAVQPEALAPLTDLLSTLAGQPLRVLCSGAGRLEQLLRQHTVSGQRAQPVAWWRLRLAWLRLAQRADEFDLVALDYCITYEVSPPSWEDVRCRFVAAEAAPPGAPAAAAGRARGNALVAAGRLAGEVAGDAGDALAPIADRQPAGAPLAVDCSALVRIDFAAAGSVLNWAAAQQAAGRQVEFQDLHRLVAIFFHVIGVAEHAKVLPREH
ncbi:STAS domain-containing protein [Pseudorhodoferax sp.]|uniref:STAS domain-containing protein n=1 Tax=Pseudorhodoferax sp. TaxID=1993553 RepID=UPI002DD6889A|nr:STAS domain-containing protein [Pseudorhodoferax sp.]